MAKATATATATQSKQDVCYWLDDKGCVCVDLYAKALEILNGNDPDCWEYDMLEEGKECISHATLVGGSRLQVKGILTQWCNQLMPNALYHVYFDIRLRHNAKGFRYNTVTFEFVDQDGTIKRCSEQLVPGDTQMLVGKFNWNPDNPHNVTAKMYNFNCQEKSGLVVRRMRIINGGHGNGRQGRPDRPNPSTGLSDGSATEECLASNGDQLLEMTNNGFWGRFIINYGEQINHF